MAESSALYTDKIDREIEGAAPYSLTELSKYHLTTGTIHLAFLRERDAIIALVNGQRQVKRYIKD